MRHAEEHNICDSGITEAEEKPRMSESFVVD
jgi:hypothetical protein